MIQGNLEVPKSKSQRYLKNSNPMTTWMTLSSSSLLTWKGLRRYKKCASRLVHLSLLLHLEIQKILGTWSISEWDTRNVSNGAFKGNTKRLLFFSNCFLKRDSSLLLPQASPNPMPTILNIWLKWADSKQSRHHYRCIAAEGKARHLLLYLVRIPTHLSKEVCKGCSLTKLQRTLSLLSLGMNLSSIRSIWSNSFCSPSVLVNTRTIWPS